MRDHLFSASRALRLGEAAGVDWDVITLEEYQRALDEEGADYEDDETLCAKRAWEHARGDPTFGARSWLVG